MELKCTKCSNTKLEDVSYMDAYFNGEVYMCLECNEFIFVAK